MTVTYVRPDELAPGMLVWLAYSSTTPSRVVEVGEPSHGLAALHGGLRVVVETYSAGGGHWGPRRAITVWPGHEFRVEDRPDLWEPTTKLTPTPPRV